MFSHCKTLISLNLSSFDTTKVTEMCYMFNNDINLKYLDISHFSPLNVNTIVQMFNKMPALIYLNIQSLEVNEQTNITESFNQLNKNLKICSNENSLKNNILNQDFSIDCNDICFIKNIKLDIIKNECIHSCKNNGYSYECNNICYNECPEETHIILKDENNKDNIFVEFEDGVAICLDRNPEGYYLDDDGFYKECFGGCKFCYGRGNYKVHNCIECRSNYKYINEPVNITNCYLKCQYYYYFNSLEYYFCTDTNSCPNDYPKIVVEKLKCIDKCENDNIYKYEYDNNCYLKCPKGTIKSLIEYQCLGEKNINKDLIRTDEDIYHQLRDNIINKCNISKGEEMVYNGKYNYSFHITSTDNELELLEGKSNNTNKLSIVDLRKCENKLKSIYNINLLFIYNNIIYLL